MLKSTWFAPVMALGLTVVMGAAAWSEDWGDQKDDPSPIFDFRQSKALCRVVKTSAPPAGDRLSVAQISALKGCDSESLYYGEHGAPDYVRARQCAMAETQNGQADADKVFGGYAILMMVYANGLGAPRNLDLATHFACNLDGAPAEMDGRVLHLARMKTAKSSKRLDFCDDITSGRAQGECASRDATKVDVKRRAGLDALEARIAPGARTAYAALRKAAYAYADIHSRNEVDLTGTARGALVTEEEEATRAAFVKQIRQVLDGKVAAAGSAQAHAADAGLNATWRKLKAHGDPLQKYGTVVLPDVLKTQRTWLTYRDAFIAFALAQAPGASTEGLFVALTRDRADTLAGLPD